MLALAGDESAHAPDDGRVTEAAGVAGNERVDLDACADEDRGLAGQSLHPASGETAHGEPHVGRGEHPCEHVPGTRYCGGDRDLGTVAEDPERDAELGPEGRTEAWEGMRCAEEHSIGSERLRRRDHTFERRAVRHHVAPRAAHNALLTRIRSFVGWPIHEDLIGVRIDEVPQVHLDSARFGRVVIRDEQQPHELSMWGATLYDASMGRSSV